MSVLIKGMEMPKSCFACFAFNAENTYCALYSHGIPARHSLKPYEKPEWCELIEVPTPHGRLIDADALKIEMMDENLDGYQGHSWREVGQIIDDAPTVIESEGE